jgi:soluble lytic murein transglycosylase-like protein
MYEYDEYWEEEPASSNGGWFSLYTLPPIAAAIISLVLIVVMGKFAYRQLEGADLSQLAPAPFESPAGPAGNDSTSGGVAPLFSPAVQYWSASILGWAAKWELDPNLIATVMQIESCGHPSIQSSAGATGLFQVMPYHFKPGEDHTDPDTNAQRGMAYLRRSLETHDGDVYLALAGYNGGITGSQRPEANWPAETKRYVYWGSGIYEDAAAGRDNSDRLDEWLAAGGASLCRKAAQVLGINP